MTKQERKVILIGVGIVIIALITLLVVNKMSKQKELIIDKPNNQIEQNVEKYVTNLDDGTKLNNSEELKKIKKYKDIEISNIQFTYENGKTILLADVKNTGSTKHTSEILKLTILGEDNQEIDKANVVIPDMEVGETDKINVTISGVDSVNAKNFKIEEK